MRVASSPRICSSFLAVDVILAAIPWKPPVSFISSGAAALSVIENRWLKTIRDERARRERTTARERLFFREWDEMRAELDNIEIALCWSGCLWRFVFLWKRFRGVESKWGFVS